jgi:uncharacterized protein (TIGR03437 family)
LPTYKTLIFAGIFAAVAGVQTSPAQSQTSVAHLAVQSGNGQVVCICNSATLQNMQPISVKATDNNGNPVQGATVSWAVTSGEVELEPATNTFVSTATSTTNGQGIATIPLSLIIFNNFSSTAVPYLVSTIQASTGNNSVTFTETQSLIDQNSAASVISAASPTFAGVNLINANLSANVGATLTTPIIVDVGGLDTASNGVPNVSVRILNEQASPQLTCAPAGGYADPGSVLSNTQGVATCYPVFSGSGTGTFYILIGGVPGTDISTALDLQAYPGANQQGYTFTSIPGAPASVQVVSGNNQVAAFEVPLAPLVAKLVDANGNPVQGQQMVWSVLPAGAVGFSILNGVTDNNGEVTQTGVTLNQLASAGATITVALQSNPNISAVFQETVQGALTKLNYVNGNNQSAQVGTTFALPLVVQVLNAAGPVVNYPVQYIVSGPLSIPYTTVGTNSQGDASLTVVAGSLTGTGTVTAIAGALTQVFNLTVTPVSTAPPPNALAIVSGNGQSAAINAPFGAPLIVQVNSTAGPVANYAVTLSTTGPVTLPGNTVSTGANGQAIINVTAGSTPGAGTVTASITGGYTATFNLTVNGIGPSLTAASFLNAASGVATISTTPQLSPCSLATISASGLTPDNGTADLTAGPIFGRFPKSVNNLKITFGGIPAPILRVQSSATNPQVTVQVPCEVTPGNNVPVVVNVNGGGTATANIPIGQVSPGIFTQVMSDGVTRAVATRADGSFADVGGADTYDPSNPVRLNEDVRFYVTGIGATTPAIGTDAIQNPNADLAGVNAVVAGGVVAGIVNGPTLQVISARPAPDLVGVYEIQVMIPGNAPTGNSVGLYIGIIPVGSSATLYAPNVLVPIGQ